MRDVATRLRLPALVGLALVLPFILLEATNTRGYDRGFPLVLFAVLWLLPTAFILVVTPIVRDALAGRSGFATPTTLLLGIGGVVLIARVWGGIVADQLPCFLGVPNCD